MRNPLPHVLRRKTRWFRQADAYVDGRVTPVERDLFEERLEESPELQEHVRETRQLKQMLSELPEHPAPRSFAINPGMLAERDRRSAPLVPRVALQVGRATAVLSIAALVFTGLFDVTGDMNGGSDDAAVPASGDIEAAGDANGPNGGADGAAPAGTTAPASDADDSAVPETFEDDDAGAAGGNGAEEPGDSESLPADEERAANGGTDGGDGESDATSQLQSPEEEPGGAGAALLYGSLVSLAVLALGVWIYAKRRLAAYS